MGRNHLTRNCLVMVVAACLLSALAVTLVCADTPSKAEPAGQQLTKELDQPRSINIADQPLPQAVKLLREQTKLNIALDPEVEAMFKNENEQLAPNATLQVKDVKLRQGLRSLLEPYRLHFAVIGDRIVIGLPENVVRRQMAQRVTVDLDQVPLAKAVQKLAKETGANLVIDSRAGKVAETPVTLQAEDVPLETTVHLLAEMAGLKPVRVGNILFVTTKESASAMASNPDLGGGRQSPATLIGPAAGAVIGAATGWRRPNPPPAQLPAAPGTPLPSTTPQ